VNCFAYIGQVSVANYFTALSAPPNTEVKRPLLIPSERRNQTVKEWNARGIILFQAAESNDIDATVTNTEELA